MRAIDPILVLADRGDDVGGSSSGGHAYNIVVVRQNASQFSDYN
jgi:hypothetical protein